MPTGASTPRPPNLTHVLEFARAFRAAARAVAFYPASHQNVVSALDQVVAAARAATAHGPLCLTILPQACMAGGVPIDSSETVVADLAALCHRHNVGAVNLDGKATVESWRAFFSLLARKPEDVRGAGGIQRQWKALRHRSPAIFEIDFGALLRGQVGGDFIELAGAISHYLETAGVGGSILDDPCGALRRAIENAPDEDHAVAAVLRELRAAAQLTWTQPDQFDDVFRRAAAVGEHLAEGTMAGLLDRRGTPEAMVGTVDVVTALVERMPDATVSKFMSKVMGAAGTAPARLADVFKSLVPDAARRRLIVLEARDVTLEENVVEQWAELERNLEAYADRRFISDQYVEELHSAQSRADRAPNESADPPERLVAWVRSIDDEAVRELDLQLLADLARLETEQGRSRRILDILQAHVLDAAGDNDWVGVARTVEAIRGAASESADGVYRLSAMELLQKLAAAPVSEQAIGMLADTDAAVCETATRVLSAVGSPLMPAIARRWAADPQAAVRPRLEQVVLACGRPARETLRRVLASDDEATDVRVAAIRLLELTPGTDHLPAFEAALSDREDAVRREAFGALANSSFDRAFDILARGIARADAASQAALLDRLASLGGVRMLPVLQRLFPKVDPRTVAVPVYLSMIGALKRAGTAADAALLTAVFERTPWSAPLRAWRFRAAARSALRAMRGRAAASPRGTQPAADAANAPSEDGGTIR